MNIKDEILAAYLDGELDAGEMSRVAEEIKASPDLARRLEKMRQTDKLLEQACHAIDDHPVPDNILKMLKEFPEKHTSNPESRNQAETVVAFARKPSTGAKTPTGMPDRTAVWQMAAAASIALVLGLGLGRSFLSPGPAGSGSQITSQTILAESGTGTIGPDNALFAALEQQPSGVPVSLGKGRDILVTPVMTFRGTDDRYCREFTVASSRAGTRSVACRGKDKWFIQLAIATGGRIPAEGEAYQTAASLAEPVIDDFIRGLIKGDAFGAEQETRIIKQKWRRD